MSHRHEFGHTMPIRDPRNAPNSVGPPGGFLSREELTLPRSTVQIVGIVLLVPLVALIVWVVLDLVSAPAEYPSQPWVVR